MSAEDKIKNTAEKAKGKLKEGVGKATGNQSLEAEGHADRWTGGGRAGMIAVVTEFDTAAGAGGRVQQVAVFASGRSRYDVAQDVFERRVWFDE